MCTNTLALPIATTDDHVLSIIEGEVLGTRIIEELLALVDRGDADESAHLNAERDRLGAELERLVGSIAAGVPAATVAPAIHERQANLARVEARLRVQRPAPPNIERLRAALEQRAEAWKADLRADIQVARLVMRRLIGPITLWDESDRPDFCRWEAPTKTEILDGLLASPAGFVKSGVLLVASPSRCAPFREFAPSVGVDFSGALKVA